MPKSSTPFVTFAVSLMLTLIIMNLFFDWALALGMTLAVYSVYALVWFRRP